MLITYDQPRQWTTWWDWIAALLTAFTRLTWLPGQGFTAPRAAFISGVTKALLPFVAQFRLQLGHLNLQFRFSDQGPRVLSSVKVCLRLVLDDLQTETV
jgi:hypothetical protein